MPRLSVMLKPARPTLFAIALAAVLAVAAPAAPGVAAVATDASSNYYEDALERYHAGDYVEAVIQLKNALQENPRNIAARVLIGEAYLRLGAGAGAEKEFKRARKDGADDALTLIPLAKAYLLQRKYDELLRRITSGGRGVALEADILVMHGRAYLATNDLDKAEQAFVAASRLRPDAAAPILGQAMLALKRGDLASAESLAERASAMAPADAETWYVKGEIRRANNDMPGALDDYDQAIESDDGMVAARIARVAVLIELNRDGDALAEIERIDALVPDDPQAAYFHALLLARAGDMDKAKDILQGTVQAITARDPSELMNDAPLLLLVGTVSYALKNFDDAYLYLGRFVGLAPYHIGARRMLGALLLRRGEPAAAVDVLTPALKRAPDDSRLLALLATAYMRNRDYAKATPLFEKAVALAPTQTSMRADLALSRLATGQRAAAVEDLEAVLAQGGDTTASAVVLALVHLKNGAYDDARCVARAIIERAPDNPFPHNLIGVIASRVGDTEAARENFERAVTLDPDYLPAQMNLAALDIGKGDRAAAADRYRAILERNPGETRVMYELARLAESAGDSDTAIAWLERIGRLDPDALPAQFRLIDLMLRGKKPQAALDIATDLERRHPRDLGVLEAIARAELALGQPTKAVATFERMAAVADTSAADLYKVARLEINVQDIDGARRALTRAIRLDPNFLPAHAAMAEIDARTGHIDQALKRAENLRRLYPKSSTGDILVGDAMRRMGRPAEAVAAYETAFAKDPSATTILRLYRARRDAGDRDAALRLLERWVADNPTDTATRRALAAGYIDAGRPAVAIEQTEALLRVLPDDPALINNLAGLYQQVGDPRAQSFAERALGLAPDEPATLDTLGWILVQGGAVKRGLTLLREAATRATEVAEIRYHLAVALSKLGRDKEARRQLEKALAVSRRPFAQADDARALLRRLSGG